jgi:hypothetical protein
MSVAQKLVSPRREHLDAVAAIRHGLTQAKQGKGRSVDEVFDNLEREPNLFLARLINI